VPSEATVFLARHGSTRGFVLSEGVNPYLSDLDTYAMAQTVVDEAVRRQLCAGARLDRIAALDNFCWPDPIRSEKTPDGEHKLAQLVRACRGLHDACLAYGVPLISGKDSMKNEAVLGGVKISVPPTLLLSAIGQIDDVRDAVTLDFKSAGDVVFVLGETGDHTGGSEYYRHLGELDESAPEDEFDRAGPAPYVGTRPPALDLDATLPLYQAFAEAVGSGEVRSAATPTKGGLGVALARSAMAGGLGVEIDLDAAPGCTDVALDTALFAETNGRFIVTVAAEDAERFETRFAGFACARVGHVRDDDRLELSCGDETVVDLGLEELRSRFKEGLADA
jgi:phosphoribosylformylglycinamidine synthase